jgi:hypothetical protein
MVAPLDAFCGDGCVVPMMKIFHPSSYKVKIVSSTEMLLYIHLHHIQSTSNQPLAMTQLDSSQVVIVFTPLINHYYN